MKQDLLNKLKEQERNDLSLPLRDTATNLVFGEGSADAKVIFLGEAPGRFEDEKGQPFIGAAGKILDELLTSIHLKREDVFITSILHYRPPKNRQPKPSEVESFAKYVDEIIKIINPKIIATLGQHSLNKFITGKKISEVHGKIQKINWQEKEIVIVPLYHPAAILYRRNLKSVLEEDFAEIKKHLKN